jgi:MFS transporter, CP family, cyanate transporter
MAATLLVLGLNLRPASASVGPVLREIQAELGVSDALAGLLTATPPYAFGLVALSAGWLGRRVGAEVALLASSGLLLGGLVARALTGSVAVLFVASFVALVGIALSNVFLPVAVERWFPSRVARMTGIYSMALTLGAFAGSAFTYPFAAATLGWRAGLLLWAVPAAIAPFLMVRIVRRYRAQLPPAGRAAVRGASLRLHRRPRAWALSIFLGIQAQEAFVLLGWLPALLRDAGVAPTTAGWLLSVTMLMSIPINVVLPAWMARLGDQRVPILVLTACAAVAYVGLIVAPARFALLWVILSGIAMTKYTLAVVLINQRSSSLQGTTELSSMVQGVGFLLAGTGPLLFGILHDVTGGWEVPMGLLTLLLIPKVFVGLAAGRPGAIDAPPEPSAGSGTGGRQ